jgi:hypothetical protein
MAHLPFIVAAGRREKPDCLTGAIGFEQAFFRGDWPAEAIANP